MKKDDLKANDGRGVLATRRTRFDAIAAAMVSIILWRNDSTRVHQTTWSAVAQLGT